GIDGNQSSDAFINAGAAYIFTRDVFGWSQQTYIKASNTDPDDFFGQTIAVSTDGNTLAVGAIGEDSSATGVNGDQSDNSISFSGAVYTFARDGNDMWSQQAYIKAVNPGISDQFCISLDLSGDGNRLVVGADFEDSNATGINGDPNNDNANNSGAAYVYNRDGAGVWSPGDFIKASNTDFNDEFGWSVTLSGDGGRLAVGGVIEASSATGVNGDQSDNSVMQAGAAYVFDLAPQSGGLALIDFESFQPGDGVTEVNAITGPEVVFEPTPLGGPLFVSSDPNNGANQVLVSGTDPSQADLVLNFETAVVDLVRVTFPDNPSAAGIDVSLVACDASTTPADNGCTTEVSFDSAPEPTVLEVTGPGIRSVIIESGASDMLVDDIVYRIANFLPNGMALSNSSILEGSGPGTPVGNLSTSDPDISDTHVYSLVAGSGDNDNGSFQVVGDQLQSTVPFDAMATPTLSVRIQTDDQNGGTFADVFTITVTTSGTGNQPPAVTLAIDDISVLSGDSPPPVDLFPVFEDAEDPDAALTLSVSGNTNPPITEVIDFFSGQMTILPSGIAGTTLITIRATDTGGLFADTSFNLTVTAANQPPTGLSLDNTFVNEGQPPGTLVGTFSTTDPDAGDTHIYSLVAGTGDTDNASFQIVGSQLQTATILDFETSPVLSIRVQTDDQNGGTLEESFSILVGNVPDRVTWISTTDGNWDDPANWSPQVVPTFGNEAIIDLPGDNPVVTIPVGFTVSVDRIESTETVIVDEDATLGLANSTGASIPASLVTDLQLQPGSSLQTSNIVLNATVTGSLDGVNLIATGAGELNIIQPTTLLMTEDVLWLASGAGALIDFIDLQSLELGTPGVDAGPEIDAQATSGGAIILPELQTLTVNDGTSAGQRVSAARFVAANSASVIDLSSLTTFVDADTDGQSIGLSLLDAQDGGDIVVSSLTDPSGVEIALDGGASFIDLDQMTSITDGILVLDADSFAFPNLASLQGTTVEL
ncbi:MAG: hypothetical protein KJO35_03775, partial [Gammaproteobacteria bacterium]|nr:hypothetical protein [Gammaproteobacteria bacterium]